jgi:hypothetical protein
MDAIELLRWQTSTAWDWLDETVGDITEEQANWRPAGTANPIGANYAHLMITADAGFNSQLLGGMPIMATRFRGQIGLSEMPHAAGGWDDWSRLQVDWARLREYGQAVRECVEAHVNALTPEDLERRVDMTAHGLGVWKGLRQIDLHSHHHVRIHGGEIAVLKGMQGLQGYARVGVIPDGMRAQRSAA